MGNQMLSSVIVKIKKGTESAKDIEKKISIKNSNSIRIPKTGSKIVYHAQRTFK